ncbi:hypothetical protein PanWU01x14_206990 [Parasponia andersonii]|uniref:DUF4408 domain-containing protein n=1 Tax=Parasponia andersonii TaxID=3476 RepID=A0A2P5BVC6_PARAD|nr:hypothetical protein PanWU01x14_206990 [Parasponia andersonii]
MSYSPFQKTRFETIIWAGKLLLLFAGMVSTLTLVKAAVIPYVVDLALSTVPQIWMSFRSWVMSPLYIYIVVNFIIVAIAATSTFQPRNNNDSSSNDNNKKTDPSIKSQQQKVQLQEGKTANNTVTDILFAGDPSPEINSGEDTGGYPIMKTRNHGEEEEEKRVSTIVGDKLLAGDKSPDTKSGVYSGENPMTRTEEEEDGSTLEATWEAIMAGLKLKKSESWDMAPRLARAGGHHDDDDDDQVKMKMKGEDDPVSWARREMRKSDTFSDRVSLRREKSMSPEELNQRAEAFIKKVNNDIRLQRLESDQRFLDMVNRGL